MPADRFYFDGPLEQGASIELKETEHHHVSKVMRVAVGEEVEIVNGRGGLARAQVISLRKEATQLHLTHVMQATLPLTTIALAIPFMRLNKLEWTLEKAVELGADSLLFYAADFSEKLHFSPHQLERMHNLAIAALKQSGRLFLPSFEILTSLENALCYGSEGMILFGDTRPDSPNILGIQCNVNTLFVTGPERGFSADEVRLLGKKAKGVRLNPYILRAETAPLVAVSILALYANESRRY